MTDAKTVPLAQQEPQQAEVIKLIAWLVQPPMPPTDEKTLAAELDELTARGFVTVDDAGRYSVTDKGQAALAVNAEPSEESPLWVITLTKSEFDQAWDLLADEIRC